MSDSPWYTDHTHLSALARWLIARDALPLDEVAYFLEKPWKWSGEYDVMCREQDRDACQRPGCSKEAAETVGRHRLCAGHAARTCHTGGR